MARSPGPLMPFTRHAVCPSLEKARDCLLMQLAPGRWAGGGRRREGQAALTRWRGASCSRMLLESHLQGSRGKRWVGAARHGDRAERDEVGAAALARTDPSPRSVGPRDAWWLERGRQRQTETDRGRGRGMCRVCEPAKDAGFCDCTEGDLHAGARKRLCVPVCWRAEPVSTSRRVPECADVPATNIY